MRPDRAADLDAYRRDRDKSRLRENVRQAALLATPSESIELDRIVTQAATGALPLAAANQQVIDLRRTQADRRARAA